MKQIALALLIFASSLCGQTAVFPSAAVTDGKIGVAANNVSTTLFLPLTATSTSVIVSSATGISPNMLLTISPPSGTSGTAEVVMVCNVSGNTLSVGYNGCPNLAGRGFDGTSAGEYPSSSSVSNYVVAWNFNSMRKEIEALEGWLLSGNLAPKTMGTSGYFPTVTGANGWGAYFSPQGIGDTKVMLAGTVASSAGQTLCTDGNYGATTSGCSSGSGGATIASTTNLIKGDGAGNGIASTAYLDGSAVLQNPGGFGTVGSTNTGLLDLTGKTSSSTVVVTVDDSTSAYTVKLPVTAATGAWKGTLSGSTLTLTPISTARGFGYTFNGAGTALTAGQTGYYTVPFACTISAWNMTVDTGTATVDIWKIATGTGIPTISNTITASATPAIASNNSLHSTTLTGWTTAVAVNDIVGINLKATASATVVNLTVQCDQ